MKMYNNTIYNEWKKMCIKEDGLVVRGRIIGISKGKNRDVWTITSDKRYSFLISEDIRNEVSKGDLVAVFSKKRDEGSYWIEKCMSISKMIQVEKRGDLCMYPRNDKREKGNYHLRLLNDEKTMAYMQVRATVLHAVRKYLEEKRFLENSITNIQKYYYGGNAIPFVTHVNYLHKDCYLKPNSQVPFIICMAGGIERMYEISEYYRNGGIDEVHTVPYTAVEILSAYTSYREIRNIAKDILECILHELESAPISLVDLQFLKNMKSNKCEDIRKSVENQIEGMFKVVSNEEMTYQQSKEIYNVLKRKMLLMDKLEFLDYLPDSKSPFIKKIENDNIFLYRGYAVINGVNVIEYFEGETNASLVMNRLVAQKGNEKKEYQILKDVFELGIPQYSYITISIDRIISFALGERNLQKYKLTI